MSAEGNKESGASDDVAAKAAEEILGPNPFVGLRPRDVLATAGTVGAQAVKQPLLLLEQEGALARDLIAILSGNSAFPAARQRPALHRPDLEGQRPSIACSCKAIWPGAMRLNGFIDRSALDGVSKERARYADLDFDDRRHGADQHPLGQSGGTQGGFSEPGGVSLFEGVRNLLLGDLVSNQGTLCSKSTRARSNSAGTWP